MYDTKKARIAGLFYGDDFIAAMIETGAPV